MSESDKFVYLSSPLWSIVMSRQVHRAWILSLSIPLTWGYHWMCVQKVSETTGLTLGSTNLMWQFIDARCLAPYTVADWCLALQWHFEDHNDKNSDTLLIQAAAPNHSFNQFHTHTKRKLWMSNVIMCSSLYNHDSATKLQSHYQLKVNREVFSHSCIRLLSSDEI